MLTKKVATIFFLVVAAVFTRDQAAFSQGCVAVRPMSCSASGALNNYVTMLDRGQWQFSGSYRYFKSFRHFRGDVEEKERVEEGTQVENITHAIDMGLSHGLSNRWALSLNLPVIYYDRSSLYEHYGNSVNANPSRSRFHTGATGIGDTRLTVNYTLLNPEHAFKGNISMGVGIKMPTGNANVQDEFHRRTADGRDSVTTKPVDQSIQLGDGGWGINLELSGFRQLFTRRGALVFNGFYLANPENVNYIVSIEPTISYSKGLDLTLNFPIALYRNRTKSVFDLADPTGERHGDAAFADYLVNLQVSYKFGKKHGPMDVAPQITIPQ